MMSRSKKTTKDPTGRSKEREPTGAVVPFVNFYELIPKSVLSSIPAIHYKAESKINIKLPSGFILIGQTGSGKTNWLLNFLSLVDSFDRITVYAKNTEEPLYQWLFRCLETAGVQCDVFDNLDSFIPSSEYDPQKNNCVVIDDFMNESAKALAPVNDLFTMGRKRNITPIWITQSFFRGTPQTIRLNASYIVIFRLKSRGDAKRICADGSLDTEPDELIKLLSYVQSKGQGSFMLLDRITADPKLKVRVNWGGAF